MAMVIYSEELGVYLGSCMGFGFWSKLDPAGQDAAVVFDNAAAAEACMSGWDGGRPAGVRFVEVQAVDGYAPLEACVEAGLPGWDVAVDLLAAAPPAP